MKGLKRVRVARIVGAQLDGPTDRALAGMAPPARERRQSAVHPNTSIADDVAVGEHCVIGRNSCIDGATRGETRIVSGCRVDNRVQGAHNNANRDGVWLVAQTGIAGRCRPCHYRERRVNRRSGGGIDDLAAGEKVRGMTARAMTRAMREQVLIGRPPGTPKRLRRHEIELEALRDRIAALEGRLAEWSWCNFPRHESTN